MLHYSSVYLQFLKNTGEAMRLNVFSFCGFQEKADTEVFNIIFYIRIMNYFKFRENVAE